MQAPSERTPALSFPSRSPAGGLIVWDAQACHAHLTESGSEQSLRTTERLLEQAPWLPGAVSLDELRDEENGAPVGLIVKNLEAQARRKRQRSLVLQWHADPSGSGGVLMVNDARTARRWCRLEDVPLQGPSTDAVLEALDALVGDRSAVLWPHGMITAMCRALVRQAGTHDLTLPGGGRVRLGLAAYRDPADRRLQRGRKPVRRHSGALSHLDRLEAESIQIMREVVAKAEKPVMLFSAGKDSTAMLHMARKAFHPAPPPFPLLHVDTRWEFQELYDFRDAIAADAGMELLVYIHPDGPAKDINPFDHGSALHTDVMKTQALKLALDEYGFDVAFGGARRDEEKSRAKERVFSFRTRTHRWDPRAQRPELWRLYNAAKAPGEGIRVFPLSNWTEYDVWQYIYREQLAVVPLYFARERPTVVRDGTLIVVADDRMRLFPDEVIELRRVRFRTLGCYPLTGAIESDAADLESIVLELIESRSSERQGRLIDKDPGASMEQKKQEGYF